jgi:hypothetical protein
MLQITLVTDTPHYRHFLFFFFRFAFRPSFWEIILSFSMAIFLGTGGLLGTYGPVKFQNIKT